MDEVLLLKKYSSLYKFMANDYVLGAFQELGTNGLLDLSGYPVSNKLCGIIGNILKESNRVTKLKLSDCMISPEGFRVIIESLAHSTVVIEADFYGNNIGFEVAKYLGKLLHENSSIKILTLNWNSMGNFPDGFALFCDGISCNKSLEFLDLRNNQLSSICGQYLASALLKNDRLRKLDLRWNRLHNEGINFIQNSLLSNSIIREIYLNGNFAYSALITHTENHLKLNEDFETLKLGYEAKIALLEKNLREAEIKRIEDMSQITEEAHQDVMKMEKQLEETMNKLIKKEKDLQKNYIDKEKILNDVLCEKINKIEIMEELKKEKEINIDLREKLTLHEIKEAKSREIFQNTLEKERQAQLDVNKELNEKKLHIEELKYKMETLELHWEQRLKKDMEEYEVQWKNKLEELEKTYKYQLDDSKTALINQKLFFAEEKEMEINAMRINLDKAHKEKADLDNEMQTLRLQADKSHHETSLLKEKLLSSREESKVLAEQLKLERIFYSKTKNNFKKCLKEMDELNAVIDQLKGELLKEKLNSFNMTQRLSEANCKLNIEREEEKLRFQFLSTAVNKYLSAPGTTV